MREIKFRAWDNRENRWMTADEIMERVLVNPSWDGKQFQIDEKSANGLARDIGYSFELMQFTGLKDKNGKEIYEGDVVTWRIMGISRTAPIYYDEDQASFWMGNDVTGQGGLILNDWMRGEYEVIGNIYENPDLLKGGQS